MKELLELLNPILIYLGISVENTEVTGLLMLSLYYLIMSSFILLNFLNICFYLFSIYIVNHEKLLNKIPAGIATSVHKILKFYTNIRIGFIVFESVLSVFCLIVMISVSYGIVYFYLHNVNILKIVYTTIISPVFGKYLILTLIFVNIICIIRYIFLILMINLISNNKIKKSIFLPFFLIKTFNRLESLSKSPDLSFIIDLYYKHIVLYILLFFISLICYFMFYYI